MTYTPVFGSEKHESGGEKFFELLKKYFIIKKWFFRPKKVKISRFNLENHQNNYPNRVFRR